MKQPMSLNKVCLLCFLGWLVFSCLFSAFIFSGLCTALLNYLGVYDA